MSTSNSSSVSRETDPLVDTQQVYRPIAQLDAEHRAAFTALQNAVANGDSEAMKIAFDQIMVIEAEQKIAHRVARTYALQKATHPGAAR